jgi:hypothetical protein
MTNLAQDIEHEAYAMIQAHGKAEAENIAIRYMNGWIQDINKLPYYDSKKIKRMDDRVWFWASVANVIHEHDCIQKN